MKKTKRIEWMIFCIAAVSTLALSACAGGSAAVTPTSAAGAPAPSQTEPALTPTTASTQAQEPTASTVTTGAVPTATQVETAAQPTAAAATLPASQPENVTTFPDPAGFVWSQVVTGLNRPLELVYSPDDTGRLFVLEQPGVIRIIQNDSLLPDPFLDIREKVGSEGNEQGLLGMDFHPDFSQSPFFYINYTDKKGDTVIARYGISADNPDLADPNSETVLLRVDQPYSNHNGGGMVFGPDGYLYMSLGDGGSANDPESNGQNLDTLLGKLLRVDVNGGEPYAIPQDNPYAGGGGRPEIWAYGLRNPWRFSFDRLTGDLYIADVGQNQWEEIDFEPAGSPGGTNYGWDYREGAHKSENDPPADLVLVDPVYEYSHSDGCSVTGGYVYRGQDLPEFNGIYLFGDYCSGKIWGLLRGADGSWQAQEIFQTGMSISSFGDDSRGELYLIDQATGSVMRLQHK